MYIWLYMYIYIYISLYIYIDVHFLLGGKFIKTTHPAHHETTSWFEDAAFFPADTLGRLLDVLLPTASHGYTWDPIDRPLGHQNLCGGGFTPTKIGAKRCWWMLIILKLKPGVGKWCVFSCHSCRILGNSPNNFLLILFGWCSPAIATGTPLALLHVPRKLV